MGFFDKIKEGLSKTRKAMSEAFEDVFSACEIDEDFYDELEECLIMADLGTATAQKAIAVILSHFRLFRSLNLFTTKGVRVASENTF